MDKEKLIKHHFWILLVLALVLMPIVASSVVFGVAEATEKQAKAIADKKKSLEAARPKGADYISEQERQKDELEKSKGKVWAENYEKQKGLIKWPNSLAHLDAAYFGDAVPDEDINTFRKADIYITEFESLAELIKPTELNGGWRQVMTYVRWGDKQTSSEEAWLALEDLCIQRELLRCVHAVNMLLARCEKITTPEAEKELQDELKPVGEETVHRFANPYWQLDLAIRKSTEGKGGEFVVRGKMKNISHRRLSVGRIDFLLSLFDPNETKGRPSVLAVEGDFLPVGESVAFQNKVIHSSAPKAMIYTAEQRLDARYVPVKRVDRIAIGYHSHRTADKPLVISAMSEEAKKNPNAAPAADTAAPAGGAAPAAGAGATAIDKTPSGINRSRYVTVTKQVRRMPIGMVLIVDQAHVQDVLRAFANSRLRFQTTQFHCTHYRGGSVAAAPAMGGGAATGAIDDSNANLVEMSLYGLCSIYEKFPAKGEASTAAPPK